METIQNLVEYYEELFPISEEQKAFFDELIYTYPQPAKYMRIGCGTGQFEHHLARQSLDVTGVEPLRDLIDSANRRRRRQLMSVRYFQMEVVELTRFLGPNFYNVIACLESRVLFVHDYTLMRKFFYDCKQLLTEGGTLVLSLINFNAIKPDAVIHLPSRKSIRATLFTDIINEDDDNVYVNQAVENSTGKMLPVLEREKIYPLTKEEIEDFAREAGFTKFEFYSGFDKSPYTEDSEHLVCLIK